MRHYVLVGRCSSDKGGGRTYQTQIVPGGTIPCCPLPHDQVFILGHCMTTLPQGWPPGEGATPLQSYDAVVFPAPPAVIVPLAPGTPKASLVDGSFSSGLSDDGSNVLSPPSVSPLMSKHLLRRVQVQYKPLTSVLNPGIPTPRMVALVDSLRPAPSLAKILTASLKGPRASHLAVTSENTLAGDMSFGTFSGRT
jgi:hypothetical protein